MAIIACAFIMLAPGAARADEGPAERTHVRAQWEQHAPPPPLRWSSQGVYSAFGLAPAATFYVEGFNPALRYDFELGMHWVRGRTALFVGADGHIVQYFGRKAPGGGADGVLTLSQGPLYARLGAGVMAGIPRGRDLDDAPPAIGGVMGLGLQGRAGSLVGRVGVDYDVRVDAFGQVNQTVLLTLRFVFGF
jgi:hypothetical protein